MEVFSDDEEDEMIRSSVFDLPKVAMVNVPSKETDTMKRTKEITTPQCSLQSLQIQRQRFRF